MTTYTIEVTTKRDIPEDVVVEHIAYALRGVIDPNKKVADSGVTVRIVEVKRPRSHPFEGPELFDDEPEGEYDFTGDGEPTIVLFDIGAVTQAIGEDFPYLRELFAAKREDAAVTELRRAFDKFEAGEGDWQLSDDDKTGEDL